MLTRARSKIQCFVGAVAATACLLSALPARAETFAALCIKVYDGDSLEVRLGKGKRVVRLLGIDAPKLGQKPWGAASRHFLEKLVLRQPLRLETDEMTTDKHGRMLAYVYAGAHFVNKELLEQGHAVAANVPPNEQFMAEFAAAQALARNAGLGMWDPKHHLDMLPKDFRHKR